MSHIANRLAAALLVASFALPAAAAETVDTLDIHAADYTTADGTVKSSFVVGVGMVESETSTIIAEVKED